MRIKRDEWAKRVERWKDSGLTAEQFASELGINANTLRFWSYKLAKTETPARRAERKRSAKPLPLVEVTPTVTASTTGFELELGSGCRVCIPASFDAAALERLLAVLERRA